MNDLSYTASMVQEIKELLSGARQRVAVQVNTELLSTYWNIGRIIVEHEQNSQERAAYGKQTLKELSKDLARHIEQYTLLCGYHFLSQNPPCLCSDRIKNG